MILLLALLGGGPENVLVVVNDADPESVEVGRYYVIRRDVPRHHFVHVRIEKPFTSFAEYRERLETPVREWIAANPKSHITTIVLSRGIPVEAPIRTKTAANEPIRSVTHLLAQLAFEDDDPLRFAEGQLSFSLNPYHRSDRAIDPAEPAEEKRPLYLVTVLNAYTVADVRGMIDRSVASDGAPPGGTVYLGKSRAGDPRGMYNGAFEGLATRWKEAGLAVEIVEHAANAVLLEGKKDVLWFQFGQANWDPKFPALNSYVPGAIVDNITSIALTRTAFDPKDEGGQTKMTRFLAAGATAVHGCVREPTTGAWDREYLHATRYFEGYNLAESFFMGHPWFPWMNLISGDPLLQAFARRPKVQVVSFEKRRLVVRAEAARDGASIAKIVLYVDGVRVEEREGGEAEFDLSAFDEKVNRWCIVAMDDTKFRTQGVHRSERALKPAARIKPTCRGDGRGKATIDLVDSGAVYTWCAPGAKVPTGTAKGSRLVLEFADASRAQIVDLWVHNPPKGTLGAWTFEVPARKK